MGLALFRRNKLCHELSWTKRHRVRVDSARLCKKKVVCCGNSAIFLRSSKGFGEDVRRSLYFVLFPKLQHDIKVSPTLTATTHSIPANNAKEVSVWTFYSLVGRHLFLCEHRPFDDRNADSLVFRLTRIEISQNGTHPGKDGESPLPDGSWTFTIIEEDHTIGNMVRMNLSNDSRVLFAGYRKTHPAVQRIELKIRTDGTITPAEALDNTLSEVVLRLQEIERQYKECVRIADNDPVPMDLAAPAVLPSIEQFLVQ